METKDYDGCSDFLFETGATLLQIWPPNDGALKEIKKFMAKHYLTKDEVKVIKNKNGMSVIARVDVTLTILNTWRDNE